MPDTLVSSQELTFENAFVDGDTRTFKLKNPKENITTSQIETLNAYMQNKQIIIGDKWGGAFGRITKVTRITTNRDKLDLS